MTFRRFIILSTTLVVIVTTTIFFAIRYRSSNRFYPGFFRIVESGDSAGLDRMLTGGFDPNSSWYLETEEYGCIAVTAAGYAVLVGNMDALQRLHAAGAKLSATEGGPWQIAHLKSSAGLHRDIVALSPNDSSELWFEALFLDAPPTGFASRVDIARLVDDIESRTYYDISALDLAAMKCDIELLDYLLSQQTQDRLVQQALSRSIGFKCEEAVERILLTGAGPNSMPLGDLALTQAVLVGTPEMIRLLLAFGADPHISPDFPNAAPGLTAFQHLLLMGDDRPIELVGEMLGAHPVITPRVVQYPIP